MRIHWYTKYCTCILYTICWVLDICRYLCNYHHNQGNERIHHVQKFPQAKDVNDNSICKTEKETQMCRTVFWTLGEGEGGMFQKNSIETCILSRVKQITSPGWMHETSTWTWCTGKTQRDRVEREVGGGIGMGNTCKPMADSFQCMTKPTTIKKKKDT